MEPYEDGWVKLDSSVYLLSPFWLDGFDPIEDPKGSAGIYVGS